MSTVEVVPVIISLVVGVAGVAFVIYKLLQLLKEDTGTEKMQEISAAVQEGAAAFLNREYTYLYHLCSRSGGRDCRPARLADRGLLRHGSRDVGRSRLPGHVDGRAARTCAPQPRLLAA